MTKNTARLESSLPQSGRSGISQGDDWRLPGQTVAVWDEDGGIIGYTYPKRAKGLIKKGRAVSVSDYIIRLKDCPAHTCAEVIMMDKNYIFFNPREWNLHQDEYGCRDCQRFYGDNPIRDGLTEIVTLSNFGNHYVKVDTRLHLEKNTEYHFVFWLNGGENDARTEVCNLLLLSAEDMEERSQSDWYNCSVYRLNRAYIKPVKRYRGWELYDIPFETGDKEWVWLCFEADKAPVAVIHADPVETYDDLENEEDEFADMRPQRHNIVFTDGWPADSWYATDKLRQKKEKRSSDSVRFQEPSFPSVRMEIPRFLHKNGEDGQEMSQLSQTLAQEIADNLRDELVDEICSEIGSNVADEICENIIKSLSDDMSEELKERIAQGLGSNLAEELRGKDAE